jgi:hypothetical protein
LDVLTGVVDAAVVVSNDSDLAFPVSYARTRVPVCLVNPSPNYLAGALRGLPSDCELRPLAEDASTAAAPLAAAQPTANLSIWLLSPLPPNHEAIGEC